MPMWNLYISSHPFSAWIVSWSRDKYQEWTGDELAASLINYEPCSGEQLVTLAAKWCEAIHPTTVCSHFDHKMMLYRPIWMFLNIFECAVIWWSFPSFMLNRWISFYVCEGRIQVCDWEKMALFSSTWNHVTEPILVRQRIWLIYLQRRANHLFGTELFDRVSHDKPKVCQKKDKIPDIHPSFP